MKEALRIAPVWELPEAPRELRGEGLVLRFDRVRPGGGAAGLLPAYLYRIFQDGGAEVGRINFRVGASPHATLVAGHIGFEVAPEFRGGRVALRACRVLGPFVAEVSGEVIITCDPDNLASKRTIELLGAEYLDRQEVPEDDPSYAGGSRWKLRYRWRPERAGC
ncbi:MAG: GNAT family N-acetyltransferase [Akkermansiaceae bacterium]|nr:GNAT family N-acetyltransferase [Akkermansiaceae bacterium]